MWMITNFCGIAPCLLLSHSIAILTVCKQVFWYLNFANHRRKEFFVLTANRPLVGTLMTIGDVQVSIAILRHVTIFVDTFDFRFGLLYLQYFSQRVSPGFHIWIENDLKKENTKFIFLLYGSKETIGKKCRSFFSPVRIKGK